MQLYLQNCPNQLYSVYIFIYSVMLCVVSLSTDVYLFAPAVDSFVCDLCGLTTK